MKKLFVFIVLLLFMGLNGYICWEDNGKAVRQETNLNYSGSVTALSGGGYMTVWSDAAGGEQEMKLQKISEAGDCLWEEPVRVVSGNCYYPNGEVITETSDGDVVVAWYELDNPTLIRCQRVDTAGNRLWGSDGVTIAMEVDNDYTPLNIVADEAGGVYLVWVRNGLNGALYGLYLEADGSAGTGWSSSGEVIMPGSFIYMPKLIPDGFGGIIIAFEVSQDHDIHLQRCDNQANIHWGVGGVTLQNPIMVHNLNLLSWNYGEYALIVRQDNQYLATVIDYNGDLLFPELQIVGEIADDLNTSMLSAVRTSDGKLGLIYDETCSEFDRLTAQKIEIGGEPEWGENGVIIDNQIPYSVRISSLPDENGGLCIFWLGNMAEGCGLLYQHLDSQGNTLTGEIPLVLSELNSDRLQQNIGLVDDDCISVFWWETSDQNDKIKMQKMDAEDNFLLPVNGITLWSVLAGHADYNPRLVANGETSIVFWTDSRAEKDQVYVQSVNNATGECNFADNGRALTTEPDQDQEITETCFSEDGETFCTAYLLSYNTGSVACGVQIMDLAGNRLLGDSGLLLGENYGPYNTIAIDKYQGGFSAAWTESNGDFMNPISTLKAERIINNAPIWNGGAIVQEYDGEVFESVYLKDDKIIWTHYISPSKYLNVLRLDENGQAAPGWEEDGLVITDNLYLSVKIVEEFEGGLLIFWEEYNYPIHSVYGQYVSNDGEILWEDGGQEYITGEITIRDVEFYEENLYILFENHETSELQLARYDLYGNAQWDSELTIQTSQYSSISSCFSIWEDVIVVYWSDNNLHDVYAKIYYTDGSLAENVPEEGIAVCDQRHMQKLEDCVIDEAGNSIVLWGDERGEFYPATDPSIYIQKLDLAILPAENEEITGSNSVKLSNYPNPFMGSTILKCDLPRGVETAEIEIFNIRGQKVRTLPATRSEVEWDCHNEAGKPVGAGIYLYRLTGEGVTSKAGRMILLR